jgi:hypothetical protein
MWVGREVTRGEIHCTQKYWLWMWQLQRFTCYSNGSLLFKLSESVQHLRLRVGQWRTWRSVPNGNNFSSALCPDRLCGPPNFLNVDITNAYSDTSILPYSFMAWCLTKHADKFYFMTHNSGAQPASYSTSTTVLCCGWSSHGMKMTSYFQLLP